MGRGGEEGGVGGGGGGEGERERGEKRERERERERERRGRGRKGEERMDSRIRHASQSGRKRGCVCV